MLEKTVDENAPDTAKGKRQEAEALRAEAGRLIATAERLEALAEEQEPGKAIHLQGRSLAHCRRHLL